MSVSRNRLELLEELHADPAAAAISHHIDAGRFVTHHFALDDMDQAYDVFSRPAETGALKVVLSRTA